MPMLLDTSKIFTTTEFTKFIKTIIREREFATARLKGTIKRPNPKDLRIVMTCFLFNLIAYTGLRISEGLTLESDDLYDEYLIIKAKNSKSGKARTILFGEKTASLIRELKLFLEEYRKVETTLLFSFSGRVMARSHANGKFKELLRIAALPKHHSPHTLRHTYATMALNRGIDVYTIRDQLGHSHIGVTNAYLHLTEEAASKVRALF